MRLASNIFFIVVLSFSLSLHAPAVPVTSQDDVLKLDHAFTSSFAKADRASLELPHYVNSIYVVNTEIALLRMIRSVRHGQKRCLNPFAADRNQIDSGKGPLD